METTSWKSILISISITVQACAKDLYEIWGNPWNKRGFNTAFNFTFLQAY